MKRYIIFFLVLLLSVWVGLKIEADPGLVFIRYKDWTVETTLCFAFFVFLVLLMVLYSIGALLRALMQVPSIISNHIHRYEIRSSREAMLTGFSLLLKERKTLAEKYFTKAAKQKNYAFINYLLAAYAAKRNESQSALYLKKAAAYANTPDLKETLQFFEIKQAMQLGREAVALPKLISLYEKTPKDPMILKDLKQIYLKTENWDALNLLLPRLKNVLSKEGLKKLQYQVYEGLLKEGLLKDKGLNYFKNLWKIMPRSCHAEALVLIAFVEGLVHYDDLSDAEKYLVSALKKDFNKKLIAYYAEFKSTREDKQIALLESIQAKHPNDPELLFYLGRWYARRQLWGRAEDYLSKSLAIEPYQNKACFELGSVFFNMGHWQKASEIWSRLDLNHSI